jgi:hypothetical protein
VKLVRGGLSGFVIRAVQDYLRISHGLLRS